MEPDVNPVTKPVEEIVATKGFDELQGLVTEGEAEPVSCEVVFTHALKVPEIIGSALTVKTAVI